MHGTARVTLPTTIMRLFGAYQVGFIATCDAQLQVPNTDVMFVLDTTGSMSTVDPGESTSRIVSLRTAVTNFYNTLEGSRGSATQVRYGFVPYATSVNVGLLLRREWMVDNWSYQSRIWDHSAPNGTQGTTSYSYSAWTQTGGSSATSTSTGDPENCTAPANTTTTTTTYGAYTGTSNPRQRTITQTINGSSYSASVSGQGVCTITQTTYNAYTRQQTEYDIDNPNAGQPNAPVDWYNYARLPFTLTSLKGSNGNGLMAGGYINAYLGNQTASPTKINWPNGSSACIEERQTVPDGQSGTAYDLDPDLVPDPSHPETQWRPAIPQLVYARSNGSYNAPTWSTSGAAVVSTAGYVNLGNYTNDHAACPSPARKLMSQPGGLTSSVLQTYLNALVAKGQTYHDIGFLWGLRLISAQGLFASENTTAPNGGSIARNIIFMTDGDTETHISDYDAYGLSALDRRRTDPSMVPTDTQAEHDRPEPPLATLHRRQEQEHHRLGHRVQPRRDAVAAAHQLRLAQSTPIRPRTAPNSTRPSATIASQISQLRLTK